MLRHQELLRRTHAELEQTLGCYNQGSVKAGADIDTILQSLHLFGIHQYHLRLSDCSCTCPAACSFSLHSTVFAEDDTAITCKQKEKLICACIHCLSSSLLVLDACQILISSLDSPHPTPTISTLPSLESRCHLTNNVGLCVVGTLSTDDVAHLSLSGPLLT